MQLFDLECSYDFLICPSSLVIRGSSEAQTSTFSNESSEGRGILKDNGVCLINNNKFSFFKVPSFDTYMILNGIKVIQEYQIWLKLFFVSAQEFFTIVDHMHLADRA